MICINGAGIAGLTLANFLERLNIEYCLIEKAKEFSAIGAGLLVQPNGYAILETLGLLDELESNLLDALSVGPPDALQTLDFKSHPTRPKNQVITRSWLQSSLLKNIPREKVYLNCSITNQSQTQDVVNIQLSNGTNIQAQWLIEASGIGGSLHNKPNIRSSNQWCWRAIIPHTTNKTALIAQEFWFGQHRLGVMPIDASSSYVFHVVSNYKHYDQGNRDQHLQNLVKQTKLTHLNFENANWLSHEISERTINWGNGRIIAIGDAAHALTPNMGQGAVLAMEDAFCLANVLKQHQQETLKANSVLTTFKKQRHKRVSAIHKQSWWIGKIAHLTNPVLIWLRNLLIKFSGSQIALNQQIKWTNTFIQTIKDAKS